jgi:hypothetical protein
VRRYLSIAPAESPMFHPRTRKPLAHRLTHSGP